MKTSTGLFYDRIQPIYPVIDLFLRKQRRQLIGDVNLEPSGRLLEVGVGTGSHLGMYRDHDVTAIDLSERMLQVARRHAQSKMSVVQMDGESLDFADETFNYVVMAHVVAVAKNPDEMLNEAYRVLQPGGKCFVLNHFTARRGPGYIDRLFEPFGRLLHFRSNFTTDDIPSVKKFALLSDKAFYPFGYFKQLTLLKK